MKHKNLLVVLFIAVTFLCRIGASILVAYGTSLRSLSALAFNPQCFLLYENGNSQILDWTKVRMKKERLSHILIFLKCVW